MKEDEENFAPMSPAEIVSEMCYAGKQMEEIARLDDYQLLHVILRARDKFGRLIRRMVGLPDWVEVDEEGQRIVSNPKPFQVMFNQLCRKVGWSEDKAKEAWGEYKRRNPKLGRIDDVECADAFVNVGP